MATSNRGRKGRPAPAIVETGKDTADTKAMMPAKQRHIHYTDAIATTICARIASGESLRSIVSDAGMPTAVTVYDWLRRRPDFARLYAQAREDQADTLADELMDICETEPDVARARLMVDTRKWIASKLRPKTYGDKVEVAGEGLAAITAIHRVIIDDGPDIEGIEAHRAQAGRALPAPSTPLKGVSYNSDS